VGIWQKHIKIPQNCSHKVEFSTFQKFDKMCTPNFMKILWILEILELDVLNSSKIFNKRWIFVCDVVFGLK
jgi:hypothetical protein